MRQFRRHCKAPGVVCTNPNCTGCPRSLECRVRQEGGQSARYTRDYAGLGQSHKFPKESKEQQVNNTKVVSRKPGFACENSRELRLVNFPDSQAVPN